MQKSNNFYIYFSSSDDLGTYKNEALVPLFQKFGFAMTNKTFPTEFHHYAFVNVDEKTYTFLTTKPTIQEKVSTYYSTDISDISRRLRRAGAVMLSIAGYEIVIETSGLVQAGCTPVRPTQMDQIISYIESKAVTPDSIEDDISEYSPHPSSPVYKFVLSNPKIQAPLLEAAIRMLHEEYDASSTDTAASSVIEDYDRLEYNEYDSFVLFITKDHKLAIGVGDSNYDGDTYPAVLKKNTFQLDDNSAKIMAIGKELTVLANKGLPDPKVVVKKEQKAPIAIGNYTLAFDGSGRISDYYNGLSFKASEVNEVITAYKAMRKKAEVAKPVAKKPAAKKPAATKKK